ncbi:MAG: methyltransferase domain-containing protein [Candidatus Aminicenantes bacterium]|nr:methyltransferase domain-containing protein [Candidatus Aminicenantes bacterium]
MRTTRSLRVAAALILLAMLAGAMACRAEAPEQPAEPPAPIETTLRNVTAETVHYTIRVLFSNVGPVTRTLAPGAVDRFPSRTSMDLEFNNGDHLKLYRLEPGTAHSFRLDENGRLEMFKGAHGRADAADLAPFVPTPMPVVEKMLAAAGVGPQDVIYDIGCGDGRILITAARKYGARGVGVDIVPERIKECLAGAKEAGVEGLVEFRLQDAMTLDLSPATVVTLYLLPESNLLLRPRMEAQLRRGTRVVTHNYTIEGWEARGVKSESLTDDVGTEHSVYLYVK